MSKIQAVFGAVEARYLGTLRVVILLVASLCILAASFLVFNGARRFAISTEVSEAPVSVAPGEVISAIGANKDVTAEGSSAQASLSDSQKKEFAAFKSGPFAAYHAVYAALAQKYNKPEDKVLSRDELATEMGYTPEAFLAGEDPGLVNFVTNRSYADQLTATANGLAADPKIAVKLQQYKAAEKTSQSCSTVYEPRRGWDSNSTACSDWYRSPIGCAVLRDVPVQRCIAAYPEGITSPLLAFAQMDQTFRSLWAERQSGNAQAAQFERDKREAEKGLAMPTLLQALQAFGAFLAIMFVFLVVAIERHLRRLAEASAHPISAHVTTFPQAVE